MSSVSSCGTTQASADLRSVADGIETRMRNVPAEGGETHPIIRIVELLPAPFGPRKPNASPRATSKSMPSTAISVPNSFRRPRAWINGAGALISSP
jgi:hypothetical protein